MTTSPAHLASRSSVLSALYHLETLELPPSSSSLDRLSSYPVSGDIPITFDFSTPLSSVHHQLQDIADSPSFPTSHSFSSTNTSHTFGPIQQGLYHPVAKPRSIQSITDLLPEDNTAVLEMPPEAKATCHRRQCSLQGLQELGSPQRALSAQRPRTAPHYKAGVADGNACTSDVVGKSTALSSRSRRELAADIEMLVMAPSLTMSTLLSPVFAPPSTAPTETSFSSSPIPNHFKSHSAITAENAQRGLYSPPSCKAVGQGRNLGADALFPHVVSQDDFVVVSDTCEPPMSATSAGFPPLSSVNSVDEWRFANLPIALSWLKGTEVELMIDQEGFRAVRPAFKLVGYAAPSVHDGKPVTLAHHLACGKADFMPTRRDAFVFHHSTFDAPPVLRRVTTNGDEARDYTSHQASLSLKSDGAYSVRGTEGGEGNTQLVWRFDYFVNHKRTKEGRVMPGEKTLTPLCFSCSPELLHPSHAKKVRIVHVMRKSVASKFAAEKLIPPALSPVNQRSKAHQTAVRAVNDENASLNSAESRIMSSNAHRRTRSHVPPSALKAPAPHVPALSPSVSYHAGISRKPMHELDSGRNVPYTVRHIMQKDVLAALFDAPTPFGLSPPSRPPLRRTSQQFNS